MDPNRLHLNFGAGQANGQDGFNSDRSYSASDGRVYPTTPSTFPQPIFPLRQQPNNDHVGAQMQNQMQSPTTSGYGGGGYFSNNQQYTQQRAQQQPMQYQNQYQQQNSQSPQSPYPQRPGGYATNDPNSGLARQFSNQNLGAAQRQPSPFARHPSPNQGRPRNEGAPNQQQQYGNYLALPTPRNSSSQQLSTFDDQPPDPDPSKYSNNVAKKLSGLHVFVTTFFGDNVMRARERNARAKELDDYLKSPRYSDREKRAKMNKVWLSETSFLRQTRTVEKPDDYTTVKVIGKGAFGEVKLVTNKKTAKIYALKCLVKAEMFKKDQLAHVRAERDILAQADSDWVVKLYRSFQDPTFLYMLMEYLPGGDLMTSLIKYEVFSEDVTRFYIAEILLAIEAVHTLGFIHRDIKPDNILMDAEGHIKLTDFGLSTGFHPKHDASYYQQLLRGTSTTRRDNRSSVQLDQINLTVSNRGQVNSWRQSRRRMAYSTVGTPDYIAPEIFSGQGYTFSCDWWSLGAIMFECMIGWPPFCAEDPHDTYRKIVDWQYTLQFPEDIHLSPSPESLIRSLLCDAPNRLGHEGGPHGAAEIKAHPFFDGVNWNQLRSIHAPFKPNLSSKLDVSYFPVQDIDQADHSANWRAQTKALEEEHGAEMNLPFIGYTYRRFD
ncbi:Serine/threonine-protein kinase [Xylographa vitiligo]|nr:Serine/threonine-protein kinase [Xylographa vitiligo]